MEATKNSTMMGKITAADIAAEPTPANLQTAGSETDRLARANQWLEATLNNMGHGLSVFDVENRLILCNKIYRDTYGLPEELARSGAPLADIVGFCLKQTTGRSDPGEIERQCNWIEGRVSQLAPGETFADTRNLKDGRIVLATIQRLSDGGWVENHKDVTERRNGEQRINWLAHHDPVADVANDAYFGVELENALLHLKVGTVFALHWIDLEGYKEINDTVGKPVGDALLRSVAKRLLECVRKPDLVARLGADEFAIIQAGAKSRAGAETLAKRLLRTISEPYNVRGHEISISASIGVALAPNHGSSALELMKNIYTALHRAKAAGRGSYAFFQ